MTSLLKAELGIFDRNPLQITTKSATWTDNHPIGNVGDGPIEFFVTGTSEHYIDLNDTFIEINYHVKRNGNYVNDPIVGTDNVTPVDQKVRGANVFLSSLFSDVFVYLNEKCIQGGDNMYPYKAYMDSLLCYGNDSKESYLRTSGFYSKTSDSYNYVQGDKEKQLIAPIYGDMFQQQKYLIPKVDLRIKFQRSKNGFPLIATQGDDKAIVTITKAVLWTRKVLCEDSVLAAHEKGLLTQNAVYPINRVEMSTYTIPSGTFSHSRDNLFNGKIPKMIVVGILSNSAFNGAIDQDPFKFTHHDLNSIALYKEGESLPYKPFEPDFASDRYTREYLTIFQALNSFLTYKSSGVTYEDYKTNHCLYAFNLASDLCVELNQPRKEGSLRLEIKFKTGPANTLNVILYSIIDKEIEITKLRDVMLI